MHESFGRRRAVRKWMQAVTIVSALMAGAQGGLAHAALRDDAANLQGEVQSLQQRFQESQAHLRSLLTGGATIVTEPMSFFDIGNIALWLLWAVLIIFLGLLIAVRRSLMSTVRVVVQRSQPGGMGKGDASRTGLVQLVKIVKIKVRKIGKKRPG